MKKFVLWFKTWFVWFSSKRVLDAINNGMTFEEVEQIVKEEVNKI